ncbi:unnamed protein product [Acanthoscelides obtectus]|uniref:Uncharacterized protein n=1 Tax=Acanthoscelides obtectus TaxID=200917 RepID=A0A9P0KUQ7_ACAOB|nr:unnamed protein product [Acanthoscelides obtectus]CAK1652667.1 hypothetical protein AOBTE_LOCUS17887 [Acanthoscelides obtectus]
MDKRWPLNLSSAYNTKSPAERLELGEREAKMYSHQASSSNKAFGRIRRTRTTLSVNPPKPILQRVLRFEKKGKGNKWIAIVLEENLLSTKGIFFAPSISRRVQLCNNNDGKQLEHLTIHQIHTEKCILKLGLRFEASGHVLASHV